jgi:type II pantothenate kinase
MSRILGLDFGLTNLDVALVEDGVLAQAWRLDGGAGAGVLQVKELLAELHLGHLDALATSGGRHRDLPRILAGMPVTPVSEAEAIGRGGLALANLDLAGTAPLTAALVVSAGTGSAMIHATEGHFRHASGSAVGGGTWQGLGRLLLGTSDPLELARLAALGNTSLVDSTLEDVIGGSIGSLPADATAVNFGRVAKDNPTPRPEDVAAGLVTLVAQVISMVALNTARAEGLSQVVLVGHLLDLAPMRQAVLRVWDFYQLRPLPIIPGQAGAATALGAALSVVQASGH